MRLELVILMATDRHLIPEEPGNLRSSQEPIYLNDVIDQIQRYTIWYRAHSINGYRATTCELPGYFPFYVVQDLVSHSTDQWDKPVFSLFDKIHRIVAAVNCGVAAP